MSARHGGAYGHTALETTPRRRRERCSSFKPADTIVFPRMKVGTASGCAFSHAFVSRLSRTRPCLGDIRLLQMMNRNERSYARWPIALGWLGQALFFGASGCGPHDDQTAGADPGADVGSASLSLQFSSAVSLDGLAYSIQGNGYSNSGQFPLGKSPVTVARIGGIPVGTGYTISL